MRWFWEAGSSLIPVTGFGPVGKKLCLRLRTGPSAALVGPHFLSGACGWVCVYPCKWLSYGCGCLVLGLHTPTWHTCGSSYILHVSACTQGVAVPILCAYSRPPLAHHQAAQLLPSTCSGWAPRSQNACSCWGSWQPLFWSSLSPKGMWPGVWSGGHVTGDGLCYSLC